MKDNKKLFQSKLKLFKLAIEQPLLALTRKKLNEEFDSKTISKIPIDLTFSIVSASGNSGGIFFTEEPSISIYINFNKYLRHLYKQDLYLFCLTLADVYTHELLHSIQYLKQYHSITKDELVEGNIFKDGEKIFKRDSRYRLKKYKKDLPYFCNHEELLCYAKDSARQLLTVFRTKEIVEKKLGSSMGIKECSKASDCFYYYYDCFYTSKKDVIEYEKVWHSFLKNVYYNLAQDFAI